MICGDLMPHKITEDLFFSFRHSELVFAANPFGYQIYSSNCHKEFIDEIPSNEIDLANISFENKALKDISGQTWFPPSKKAYYFLIMIDIEKSKILDHYKSFYYDETNLNNTSHQINKEIRRINVLATELKEYAALQLESPTEFVILNPIHYIIFLLQETLIDLLSWIYKMYNDLSGIKVINPSELRSALFKGSSTESIHDQDETREKVQKLFNVRLPSIYEEFKDDIFELNGDENLNEMFISGMSGTTSVKLAANAISKFDYLLHVMWDAERVNNKKSLGITKKMYFEPILKNFNCEYSYFKNRKVITKILIETNLEFKKKVDIFFKKR